MVATRRFFHFMKITQLAPMLTLTRLEEQTCSTEDEAIRWLTQLPNGRVLAVCRWGQLCEIEVG